jgi:RNA-directed DNA polymerase
VGIRTLRKKSLNKFKDKVRDKTRRTQGVSLAQIVDNPNPMLKGWFGYFKHAHWTMFPSLDSFIRRRLRAILRKQNKRSGVGLCPADHLRWPNAFFAQAGLFTLKETHAAARNPR